MMLKLNILKSVGGLGSSHKIVILTFAVFEVCEEEFPPEVGSSQLLISSLSATNVRESGA